ncbi:hypothetical protein BJX99DRAFT_269547 [Aspergillus californicus]
MPTLSFNDSKFVKTGEFAEAIAKWYSHQAPTYSVALSIGSEEDLVTAVKLATDHNIPFLATGGRHGYGSTLGNLQDGLALDLSPLNNMTTDAAAETLAVGPGIKLSDVFDPVFNAGYEILTLGGGIGRQTGAHGLMLDALLSTRIVTASGEVLETSSTLNPDLFWAIWGAGQNFGILTSATYQLHPVSSTFTTVDLVFDADLHVALFKELTRFDISAEWAMAAMISWNDDDGQPAVIVSCIPWNELTTQTAFDNDAEICIRGSVHDIYGIFVFRIMEKFYESNPVASRSAVLFEVWANQAAVAVPDYETAYPWRDAEVHVSARDAVAAMGREARAALADKSGYDELTVYVNYAKGDEALEQIYGAKNCLVWQR